MLDSRYFLVLTALGALAYGGCNGGGEPPQGLFECDLPLTCGTFTQHAGSVNGGDAACVAQAAFTGGVGSALRRDAPGPYIWVTELLVIYTGDGYAFVQTRHKECECVDDIPWEEPSPIERCEVRLPATIQAACEANDPEGCAALPDATITNCQPVETAPTCADLQALLPAD